MLRNLVYVCLVVFMAYASLSVSGALNRRHNIICKPLPKVVPVHGDYKPYFVSLHRCQGSVGNHKPSIKECVMNTSTMVTVRAGPDRLPLANHTSCTGKCIYHKDCKDDLFSRDENLCLCQCKFDKAPNGCPPNTRWNKEECKCECQLSDDGSKLPKKLDKEKCEFVCHERKCETGHSLDEDSCICRLIPQSSGRNEDSDNLSQAKVFAALVIGEFVFLYLIFDFMLYSKKTGLMYYIKCKCWPKPRQDVPQESTALRNGPSECEAV